MIEYLSDRDPTPHPVLLLTTCVILGKSMNFSGLYISDKESNEKRQSSLLGPFKI